MRRQPLDGLCELDSDGTLVRSDRPGSLRLTAERIAEILEDDDVSA
jgi:hypothetical protein